MSISNINSSNNKIILLNQEIKQLKQENENLLNTIKNSDNNKNSAEDVNTEYLIKIHKVKYFFFYI